MVEKSNRWIPPPMTLVAAAQKNATQRAQRREEASLSEVARQKLKSMLHTLTVDRQCICDAMVWILDHAEYATEVSEILISEFSTLDDPIILKIAHLFLISDVLHNTSAAVRNVSRYRNRLQDALPDIFESLQEVYRSADSRMAQELLRKHVLKVLRVWRGWYIFSDDFLNGLQATFLRSGVTPASTIPVINNANNAISEQNKVEYIKSQALVDSELAASLEKMSNDEVEMKCKHSGLSRKGGREAQIARILALDTYLHGGDRQAAAPTGGWTQRDGEKRGAAEEPKPAEESPARKKLKS